MTGKHVFHSAVSSDMRVHETETGEVSALSIFTDNYFSSNGR